MNQQVLTNEEFDIEVERLSILSTEQMFKELLERIMILEKCFVLLCRKIGIKPKKQPKDKKVKSKTKVKSVKVKPKVKKVVKHKRKK